MPIWTLLTTSSRLRLISDGPTVPPAITVQSCTAAAALATPHVKSVRMMIERGLAHGGLKLTGNGFLSRADTVAVFDALDWPAWSKREHLSVSKVINEREVAPIHSARVTAMKAGLLRRSRGRLLVTKSGKDLLAEDRAGDLLARLVGASFWKVRQEEFDGVPFAPWPQDHAGVALWSVGGIAWEWRDADDLLTLCTMPFASMARVYSSAPRSAFFLRILRPAVWLGLLDHEERKEPGGAWSGDADLVRKTPLFDAVLRFDVELAEAPKVMH